MSAMSNVIDPVRLIVCVVNVQRKSIVSRTSGVERMRQAKGWTNLEANELNEEVDSALKVGWDARSRCAQ